MLPNLHCCNPSGLRHIQSLLLLLPSLMLSWLLQAASRLRLVQMFLPSSEQPGHPSVLSPDVPALKVGDTVTVKNVRYKVTSVSKKTVAVTGGKSKNITAAPIASTVKVKGVTCKVTTINAKAFKGYKKLKKVVIGANVTSIKSEAFAGCTSLAQVSIGKKVTTIDKKAFYGCKKLKKVVFLGTAVKKIKTGAFKSTSASMKVTLPKSTSASKRTSMKKMLTKAGMNKKATVK